MEKRPNGFCCVLFLLHFVYILIIKWVDPPITLTQLGSLFSAACGLKRDYVDYDEISSYAKLAFIAWRIRNFQTIMVSTGKVLGKAMDHNKKQPAKVQGEEPLTISQQVAKKRISLAGPKLVAARRWKPIFDF